MLGDVCVSSDDEVMSSECPLLKHLFLLFFFGALESSWLCHSYLRCMCEHTPVHSLTGVPCTIVKGPTRVIAQQHAFKILWS